MKAIVIHQYGGADQLKYEDMPDPKPMLGEVLVQMAATSVNPIDFKIRSGATKAYVQAQFPLILGRDAAGTVKELGPGVTRFKAGDRVMALTNRTYAELVVVKEHDLAHIPEGMDTVEAAAYPLVTMTGDTAHHPRRKAHRRSGRSRHRSRRQRGPLRRLCIKECRRQSHRRCARHSDGRRQRTRRGGRDLS